ncbi:MAG: hypothetical protein AAGF68_00545 [Pseudomonadota bacterium]
MAELDLVILNRSAGGYAPEGLFFEARIRGFSAPERLDRTAYDPSFHELRYRWTIRQSGTEQSQRRSAKVVNLPQAHNDTATAYGKRIGHVFTEPGDYTVSCEARDSDGAVAQTSLTLSVGSADRVFPGAQTILVDTSGRGAPERYGGAQVVNSLSAAAAQAGRLGGPARILMARGQVHVIERLRLDQGSSGLLLGAFGSGPPPVLAKNTPQAAVLVSGRFQGDLRIAGLDFQGFWDSTSESGPRLDCLTFQPRNTALHSTITDCRFSGWNKAIFCALDNDRSGLPIATYIHDSEITNWADYGIFVPHCPGAYFSLTGSVVAQHEEALMGGPKDAEHNHHGPLRLTWAGHAYIAACDMFSRTGWSPNRNLPSEQPCIRWNTSMRAGTSGVIERVAMEGGSQNLVVMNAGVPPQHYLTNLVVEKCLMVGNATSNRHSTTHTTGLTLRNILAIKPNAPPVASRWDAFLRCVLEEEWTYLDPNAPIRAYSNTVVTLLDEVNRTGRELRLVAGIEEFEIFSNENNVLIAPNAVQPGQEETGRAPLPLETAGGLWRPRYRGTRFRPSRITQGVGQLQMNEAFATPEDGAVALYLPVRGSALHESAMGTVAIDDFFGQLRPEAASRGAFEPEQRTDP